MLEISPVERPVAVPRRTSVHPAILARDFRPLPPCPPCTHGIAARCSGPPISTPIWWNTRHHFPAPQVSPAPRPRSLRTALYAGRSRSCPDHRRQYLRSEIEDTHTHTQILSLSIYRYIPPAVTISLFSVTILWFPVRPVCAPRTRPLAIGQSARNLPEEIAKSPRAGYLCYKRNLPWSCVLSHKPAQPTAALRRAAVGPT